MLRQADMSVTVVDLFLNPTIAQLIDLITASSSLNSGASTTSSVQRVSPDPAPFSLIAPAVSAQEVAKDIASQLDLTPKDIEDAFPMLLGQAIMYRETVRAPLRPMMWIGDFYELSAVVDLDRWKHAWNRAFENESVSFSS